MAAKGRRKMILVITAILMTITVMAMFLSGCGSTAGAETGQSSAEELSVTFIDVGKGDCILLEKDSSVILIDTGYKESADSVIGYLKDRGITRIDYLIITHYDKDHVGGAARIAEAFEVAQIYLPDYEGSSKYYTAFMEVIEAAGLNASRVSEDISLDISGVTLEIYASDVEYDATSGSEGNDNDVSLVVAAIYGEDSYLFAGDIEKAGIKAYLAAGHGEYDVLKMPHHGKSSGKLADFVERVNEQIAVITDSTDDPAEDAVLEMLGSADVYRSAVNGTVTITGTGDGVYTTE